jgi:hypothetical protein
MSCNNIQIFYKKDIELIDFKNQHTEHLIRTYFFNMFKIGPTDYIHNISSSLTILKINDKFIPISINDKEYLNSYVTSIFSYLPYAQEEMLRHKQNLLYYLTRPLFFFLSLWFKRSKINKIVTVNNYLLSTNLYDDFTEQEIYSLHQYLIENFPDHSILFRSLNNTLEKKLIHTLKKIKYSLITSRSIYFFHPDNYDSIANKKRWINRKDEKLLMQKDITLISHNQFSKADIPIIKKLYDMLYLEKYSSFNPQFSIQFFENALKNNAFILQGIRYQGKLVGIIGYFEQCNVIATPIVGYDTTLPHKLGLYRMLTSLVIQHSLQTKKIFHMSSGVGHFKRQRGAVQEFENMGIYSNHLKFYRSFAL